ncbi:MAG: 6-carboxytetrahydropterin synthase [Bacteroidales bacterium]|nr:6-carboxytetrahydropterin synthase [Bacteroidales bacterium]
MTQRIRLTKQFGFEAAHCLENYDGKCSRLHGHSYKLFVTVSGYPEQDENSPKLGMVMDFGLLKQIVNEEIIEKFDHSVVLSNKNTCYIDQNAPMFSSVIRFPYQPTCENMLIFFASKIQNRLPKNVRLEELKLYETADSFAQWLATDNNII